MNAQTLTQRALLIFAGAIIATIGGLIASVFRIDAFTGSDAQQMEDRIVTRLTECRAETKDDIADVKSLLENMDTEFRDHERDRDIHKTE